MAIGRVATASRSGFWLGCSYALLIGIASQLLVVHFKLQGISPLALALGLGLVLQGVAPAPSAWNDGLHWASRRLLRIGVALFGFQVSAAGIASIGVLGAEAAIAAVAGTLAVGIPLGVAIFGMDASLAALVSAGTGICGAAAVLAFESVLQARPAHAASAVATVVIFGLLSMVALPLLHAFHLLPLDDLGWAVLIGSSVHEVAQVLAAATSAVPDHADQAVAVKMMRVILLAPAAMIVARALRQKQSETRPPTPWFAWGFVLFALWQALFPVPAPWHEAIKILDTTLLASAMAALGLQTRVQILREAGWRPFALAALLSVLLAAAESAGIALVHQQG